MGTSAARRLRLGRLHLYFYAALTCAFVAILAFGVATAGAAPSRAQHASATTQCPARTMTSPFARWGDTGKYFMLNQRRLRERVDERTLAGGATVVSGNGSYHVNSSSDTHSLKLPAGGERAVGRDLLRRHRPDRAADGQGAERVRRAAQSRRLHPHPHLERRQHPGPCPRRSSARVLRGTRRPR